MLLIQPKTCICSAPQTRFFMSIAHRIVAECEADAVEQEQVVVGRRDGQLPADARLLVSHQLLESALVKFIFHPFVKLSRPCEEDGIIGPELGYAQKRVVHNVAAADTLRQRHPNWSAHRAYFWQKQEPTQLKVAVQVLPEFRL
jgi:hypothetical protein